MAYYIYKLGMDSPKGKQLRVGRRSIPDQIYLVTACCKNRKNIFSSHKLGDLVIAELCSADKVKRTQTIAYVVMPDHLHWLFSLRFGSSLPKVMRQVKGSSSFNIRNRSGFDGGIWQRGYHDRALRRNEDVEHVAKYVIYNPVRAGLVEELGDYSLWGLAFGLFDGDAGRGLWDRG